MSLLAAVGGEDGCRRFSAAFYARVAHDPMLRRLFPGKSLRCATEEFAAFLIQFLGGDEAQTQKRWWLSLRESHARFRIAPHERAAWLALMRATLEETALDPLTRDAFLHFFTGGASYVTGVEAHDPLHEEIAHRWREQRALDDAVAAIAEGRDNDAASLAARFAARRSIFIGLLARMIRGESLVAFVVSSIHADPSLLDARFAGRTLLHYAAAAGCVPLVEALLRRNADPNVLDRGGHTPLYAVANECGDASGPEVVRLLVTAGADVNACGGVTRATALHMAARRGHVEIARALLARGASAGARDRKGDTPLQRARNCRRPAVAALLADFDPTGV